MNYLLQNGEMEGSGVQENKMNKLMDITKIGRTLSGISKSLSALLTKSKEETEYLVVYKTEEEKIKSYIISKPDLYESFGNKKENRDNVGFKAYCHGRDEVRSFRHDRIVSITKL